MASKRNLELKSHRDLWEFVTKLDNERPELNLLKLFHIANSLHINFYENWMSLMSSLVSLSMRYRVAQYMVAPSSVMARVCVSLVGAGL